MVVRLIVQECVRSERDWVPAATPHVGRKDALLCLLHDTLKLPQPPSDIRVVGTWVINCLVPHYHWRRRSRTMEWCL
jgi:hypothetical protein